MARAAVLPATDLDTNASINLSRLLSRLEVSLLDPSTSIRTTSFDRIRVAANLEYARTLLIKLEQEASGSKAAVGQRGQNVKNDLMAKRQLIKRLNERLYELNQLEDDATDADAIIDDEDLLAIIDSNSAPTHEDEISKTQGSKSARNQRSSLDSENNLLSSQLRSRRGQEPNENDTAVTTSSSHTVNHTPKADPSLASTEALLSHNSSEQETLTSSLLSMASALKASSNAFASSLEAEKEVLANTVGNLEKNSSGMEAAEKRMGALRRATEGKGWLGRMLMYAYIFGLVVVAILIVGVMPKLRF